MRHTAMKLYLGKERQIKDPHFQGEGVENFLWP